MKVNLFSRASSFQKAGVHCTRVSSTLPRMWSLGRDPSGFLAVQGARLGVCSWTRQIPHPKLPRQAQGGGAPRGQWQEEDKAETGVSEEMRGLVSFIHHTSPTALGGTNGASQNQLAVVPDLQSKILICLIEGPSDKATGNLLYCCYMTIRIRGVCWVTESINLLW